MAEKNQKLEILISNVVGFGRGVLTGAALGFLVREDLRPETLLGEVGAGFLVEQAANSFLLVYPRLNYEFPKRFTTAISDDPGAVGGILLGYHLIHYFCR